MSIQRHIKKLAVAATQMMFAASYEHGYPGDRSLFIASLPAANTNSVSVAALIAASDAGLGGPPKLPLTIGMCSFPM